MNENYDYEKYVNLIAQWIKLGRGVIDFTIQYSGKSIGIYLMPNDADGNAMMNGKGQRIVLSYYLMECNSQEENDDQIRMLRDQLDKYNVL